METDYVEIYLFIDPLGRRCNSARKIINQFRDNHIEKINLRVIPIVNAKKILNYARNNHYNLLDSLVEKNNRLSTNTYQACLAFYASTMQGKTAGHTFLTELQSAVVDDGQAFSEDLVFDIAQNLNLLDAEMFMEDYQSDLTKRIYQRNLQLAAEMNIVKTPSCVIIKNGEESEAIRVDKKIEDELLHSICGLKKEKAIDHLDTRENNTNQGFNNILELDSFSLFN